MYKSCPFIPRKFHKRTTPKEFRMVCTVPFFLSLAKGRGVPSVDGRCTEHPPPPQEANFSNGRSTISTPHKLHRQQTDFFFIL